MELSAYAARRLNLKSSAATYLTLLAVGMSVRWRSELSHFQLMTARPTSTCVVSMYYKRPVNRGSRRTAIRRWIVVVSGYGQWSVPLLGQFRSPQSESDFSLPKLLSPHSPHSPFYSVKRTRAVNSTSLRGCYPPDRNRHVAHPSCGQ